MQATQANKQLKRLVGAAGGGSAVARQLRVPSATFHNRLRKGTYQLAERRLGELRAALSTLLEREVAQDELFPPSPDTPQAAGDSA